MTPIVQPEQVTYSSERQPQLMDSDCDILITEGIAAITRASVKYGGGLTRDNNMFETRRGEG